MIRPSSSLVLRTGNASRLVPGLCLGATGAACLLAWLPFPGPALTAARLLAGFCAIGIVPGLLLAVAVGRFKQSFLLFLAHGAALSLGLAQLLCVASLSLHLPSQAVAVAVMTGNVVLAGCLLAGWRRTQAPLVYFPAREKWLLGVMLLVAAVLYPKGSVILADTYEDLWHLSVLNRLAGSAAPGLTSIFVEPGLPFTHPLPGVSFFLSLVSQVAGEWPLLVYNKARSFWAVLSLGFAYATATRLFPARRAAGFVVIALAMLILNGSLADTKWHWGQAAPESHNTDVVMGVIVPGIVAMLVSWLYAGAARRRLVSLLALLGLLLTVVFSHVREAPQVLLYLVAWGTACHWLRQGRARPVLLIAAALGGAIVVYGLWHSTQVPLIKDFVTNRRAVMMAMISSMEGWDWWRAPRSVYPLAVLWPGWHPLLIVLCPLVLARWGRRSAAWAVGAIFLAALLLIRLPALSLAASYLTYDEILMFPVRFFTPFTYLIPGVLAWRLSVWLAGWPRLGPALVMAGLSLAIYHWLEPVLVVIPDLLFAGAITAAVLALFVIGPASPAPARTRTWPSLLILLGLVIATFEPRSSPLNGFTPAAPTEYLSNPNQTVWTGADILRTFRIYRPPGPGAAPSHPPPLALVEWLHGGLPPDTVLITNPDTHFVLTAFAPQYHVGWCYLRWLLDSRLGRVFGRDGAWPFFDSTWSAQRRWEFCREQGITGVLIDPGLAAARPDGFAAATELFEQVYAAEGWRVYRVKEAAK